MTTKQRLKDIPKLERNGSNLPEFAEAVREVLQTFRGYRGDPLDKALTLRFVKDGALVGAPGVSGGTTTIVGGGGGGGGGAYVPDTTPPPTATGLAVTAGLSYIYIEHDIPSYTEGHGHDRTVVYGAKWPSGSPPTFGDAVELMTFQGSFSAYPSDTGTRWCIWIKWRTVDGVLSSSPAGGTNGVQATTGKIGNVDLGPLIVEAANLADEAVIEQKIADAAVGMDKLADNAVSVGKLLVTGNAGSLNADPGGRDISAWETSGMTSAADSSTPYGGHSLRSDPTAYRYALSLREPINGARNYQARVWARQVSGAGGCYLAVAFEDGAGNNIAGSSIGWPSYGSFFYFGRIDEQPPGSWTEYTINFGPSETAKIPTGAAFVRIGVLSNYSIISSPSDQRFTGLRIVQQTSADLIVDGGILARHLSAGSIAVGTAAIENLALVNGMFANATITDAKMFSVSVAKLIAGSLQVGQWIQSTSYVPSASGWAINADGSAEFNNVTVRGTLNASDLTAGTLNIARIANSSLTQMWSDEEFAGAAVPASTAETVICEVNVTEPSNPTFKGFARASLNISRPAYAGETGVQVIVQQRVSGVWSNTQSFQASWPSSAVTFFRTVVVETSWVYTGAGVVTDWRVVVVGNLVSTHTVKGSLIVQTFVK